MLTERIIRDAALRLFTRQGSAATTVEQIAEAAGVSERTFFRYFRTKESAAVPSPASYRELLSDFADGVHTVAEARTALVDLLTELHRRQAGEELELLQLSFTLFGTDPGIRNELAVQEMEMEKDLFTEFSTRIPVAEHLALRLLINTTLAADRTVWIHWTRSGEHDPAALAPLHARAMELLTEIYR